MENDPLPEDYLADLALKLVQNAVNISIGGFNKQPGQPTDEYQDLYKMALNGRPPQEDIGEGIYRCIVVVGAGASYNACESHKLGGEFSSELKRKFGKIIVLDGDNSVQEGNLIQAELDRLKRIYKLDPDEFETVLYAVNKYFPDHLLKELTRVYDHKHNPNFTYEILAHLMKHRFVDAVINFNFDELLDQSIEDELKADEYHRVLYDGDIDTNDIFAEEEGLRYPLYIKPHGTISHESSLRFTEEAYNGMSKNIESLLTKLLSAEIKVNNEAQSMKVILITIGFNMQSTEFNILLNRYLPQGSEIYCIKNDSEPPKIDSRPLDTNVTEKNPGLSKITPKIISVKDIGLDATIEKLWEKIKTNFTGDFAPRSILRHKLISKLFNRKEKPIKEEELVNYFWQRACVEFVLSAAKYKGFIGSNQLAEDRFGKYFGLALKSKSKFKKQNAANLIDFLIKKFEFNEWGYGGKAFSIKKEIQSGNNIEQLTVKTDEQLINLIDILDSILEKGNVPLTTIKEQRSLFVDTIKELYSGTDTEISPKFNDVYGHIFTSPKIVKNQTGL